MSLWRLEWLRLIRTRRFLVLAGVFVFFGIVGPVSNCCAATQQVSVTYDDLNGMERYADER